MAPKGKNELEQFVDKFGYNKIWSAFEELIDNDQFEIDAGDNLVLDNIDLKFARNLSVNGCSFEFDVVYEIYVNYADDYRDINNAAQWYAVHCKAEVDDIFKCFEVIGIEPYRKTSNKGNTTKDFVPIISKSQMDIAAETFLRKHYIKALLEPTRVPIRNIASEMGLKLEFGYMLSEDFSFFGQISFSDTKVKVYNVESSKAQELSVSRGTILIDPEVFWERSTGCENFTIAHEIVHWEKHKLFADIKRLLYKNNYVAHRCPKPKNIFADNNGDRTDEEWMETQANGIAARILMPKETLPAKIKEITDSLSAEVIPNTHEYYIVLIDELANFYGTSRQTAKYRLKELGYNEVDNIQLHEYDFQAYTHEIDEYKAYYELCGNAELRMLVNTGLFTYADNHFVINHEMCVMIGDDNIPRLTDFAWANLDKCTLKFANVRVNIKASGKFSDILYRNKTYETFQKYISTDNSDAFEFARELAADFNAKAPERQKLNITFSQMVRQILEVKNIDVTKFQERTLLSKSTYYRLQSEKDKPSFRSILAFCAGMDLDIYKTNELLGKAGFAFDGSEAHAAYMTAITAFSGKSIDVRNEFLSTLDRKDVSPLGDDIADRE